MKKIKTFNEHMNFNDNLDIVDCKHLNIADIEKSEPINDYELTGYDEEEIGFVEIYLYDDLKVFIVQWYSHSEKGEIKEILRCEKN